MTKFNKRAAVAALATIAPFALMAEDTPAADGITAVLTDITTKVTSLGSSVTALLVAILGIAAGFVVYHVVKSALAKAK